MEHRYFLPYQSGDIFKTSFEQFGGDLITESRIITNHSWTFYVDDEVIACGGFVMLWDGVYELWCNPPIPKKYVIPIIKKAKVEMNLMMREEGVIRIQTQVLKELKTGFHLMNILGFEYEGRLSKFINGQDYYIFGRVN